ncbi:MAG: MFS transporter [Coprobacillaceae bacterium]
MKDKMQWKTKLGIYMISQIITMLGSSIVSLSIIWYITLQTNSEISVAGITITTFLPQALIMLVGGVIADRFPVKRIIILSDVFIAGATLCLALLYFLGYQSIVWIYIFNTLRSLGTGIQLPASKSILPLFISEEQLLCANSYSTSIWSIIQLISPGLGGLALSLLPLGGIYLIDVISAVIGVTLLAIIPIKNNLTKQTASSMRLLKDGFLYLKQTKIIRNIIILYTVFQFLIVPASQLTPLLASIHLGNEVWILSGIEIAFSIGALVASLILGYKKIVTSHYRLIAYSASIFGITMCLIIILKHIPLFFITMVIMGIGSPLYYTPLITMIQENSAPEYMGRMFSYIDLFGTLATPCGMLLFGPLSTINIESSFLLPGIGMMVLGAYIFFKSRIT